MLAVYYGKDAMKLVTSVAWILRKNYGHSWSTSMRMSWAAYRSIKAQL